MANFVIRRMLVPTGVVLAVTFGTAGAQSVDDENTDDQLLRCARISESAERIACYDELAKQVEPGQAAPPAASATPAETNNVPVAEPKASVPSVAPAAAEAVESTAPASAAKRPAVAESKSGNSTEEKADSMGPPEKAVDIRGTIVQVERSGINHFVVQLDNGQVWEETDGSRRQRLPKAGAPVVIYEGRFGGYRMKIGDDNRVAWVRRLK